MKKIFILILITALMLLSCKNNSTNVDTDNNGSSTETQEELDKYGIDIDTATKEIIEEALNKYYQDKGEYKLIFKGTSTKVYDGMKNGDTIAGMVENTKIKNVVISAEHVIFENNKIKDSTFGGDQNYNTTIVKITIPDTITDIGKDAFVCANLTNVNMPKNLKTIEDGAFYEMKMEELILPEGLETIGASAFRISTFTNLVIPNSVISIGEKAFDSCKKLTKVKLPNSIKTLETSIFASCYALKSITIPASVTEIKRSAFYYSTGLESVTFLSQNPPTIGQSAFAGTVLKTIYVPQGSQKQYETLKGKYGIPNSIEIIEQQ